jgi:hypothetical protein
MSAGQLWTMLADVMKGFQAENRKMLPSESRKLAEQKHAENCKLSEMLNARIRAEISELTEQVKFANLDYLPS